MALPVMGGPNLLRAPEKQAPAGGSGPKETGCGLDLG